MTAVSGAHAVVLAMDWPAADKTGLLGFAIQRTDPDGKTSWLSTVLQFADRAISPGALYPSNEAPIQSFIWLDPGLSDDRTSRGLAPGATYAYAVTPVRGNAAAPTLDHGQTVALTISTEADEAKAPIRVAFNRGLSDMQSYERLFGVGHQPEGDDAAMRWLARGLDDFITAFLDEALADPKLRLDCAAYHLDHPGVLERLCRLGSRARVSMDWGSEEGSLDGPYEGPNGPAYQRLRDAGVTVHQRQHVNISHNKYMILKTDRGEPQAVLTGSTNFTKGGISTQSNHSVIVRNPDLAARYLADFELVLKNDNAGLRDANAKPGPAIDGLEVYFSPHSAGESPDLDRLAALAEGARSSAMFATFRMTAKPLIEAITGHENDGTMTIGVVDRVYRGGDDSGDRLLWDEAQSKDPRIVAANDPLDEEPSEEALLDELARQGYDPLIHHKILLFDFDQEDSVVVTGSANYSTNSTEHNDENSLIIRGDGAIADRYFVELSRLYVHWRPRWLEGRDGADALTAGLASDDSWVASREAGHEADLTKLLVTARAEDSAPVPRAPEQQGALAAAGPTASDRIDHVVVLMLENRSFDHMLGFMKDVDGVRAADFNLADPEDSTSARYTVGRGAPYAIPTEDVGKRGYGGPAHSYPAATLQLFGDEDAAKAPAGSQPATNNGFVKSYLTELGSVGQKTPKPEHVRVAMDAFTPEQLPVISRLAQEFCVCDQWFSEVPGPTEPNRLFMHAATSEGLTHNVWSFPIESRTIYENLQEQGHEWAFYSYDLSDSNQFPALKSQVDKTKSFNEFFTDVAKKGGLASYSFLCPRYSDTDTAKANSQHAPDDVRYGEALIADVYEAIRRSPNWERTLFVLVYDEHGGFYDHVLPPSDGVANPDGKTSPTEYDQAEAKKDPHRYRYLLEPRYRFDFDRLGCRVPAVLISPWIAKGKVDSTRYQHTSVLATTKRIFGLPSFLTKRDAQANSFEGLLEELAAPRTDAPMTLERAPLPDTPADPPGAAPLSPRKREVFKTLAQLDGHPDSGKTPPVPPTQAEASRYIAERVAAHKAHHRARKAGSHFEVYKDRGGAFRWRLLTPDGEVIATSGEGFPTRRRAELEVEQVRAAASAAKVVEVEPT